MAPSWAVSGGKNDPKKRSDRRLSQRLDQLGQTAFGASGGISVNQILARCFIDALLSRSILTLCLIRITSLDRFPDLPDLRPHRALLRPIVQSFFIVLTKSLLGAGSIWHGWLGRTVVHQSQANG